MVAEGCLAKAKIVVRFVAGSVAVVLAAVKGVRPVFVDPWRVVANPTTEKRPVAAEEHPMECLLAFLDEERQVLGGAAAHCWWGEHCPTDWQKLE